MQKRRGRLSQEPTLSEGFSTIELLVTLAVASTFLGVFYQAYVLADSAITRAQHLAAVNEVAYRKLQQYENSSFQSIPTPGGASPAQVEEFAAEIPDNVPGVSGARVNTAQITPTLKAVNVRVDFGESGDRIVEYTVYIQESGVGR